MKSSTQPPEQTSRTAADVDLLVRQAREASDVLSKNLPGEVSVAALNVWSKAPFQLQCAREALIWRIAELARYACDGLERGDLAAAALLTRAVTESVALSWKLLDLIEKRDRHSAGELSTLLMRAVSGSRRPSDQTDFPKAFHVLDLIRHVDSTVPGFFDTYEALSEMAHPNGQGVFGLFGRIDKAVHTASFGPNPEKTFAARGLIAEALLGGIGLFTPAYNRMADALLKFVDELPKIWPNDDTGQ